MFERLRTAALACIVNLLLLVAVPLAFIFLLAATSGGRPRHAISDFANTGIHFAWSGAAARHEAATGGRPQAG
jgi:hypothetical protein